MGPFRFYGISNDVANEVRETMRAPQYGHPAHRELARVESEMDAKLERMKTAGKTEMAGR